MSKELKTIGAWEKDQNVLLNDDSVKLDKKVTVSEFAALAGMGTRDLKFKTVNFQDRTEFLEANGYEVTRENLRNFDLTARNVS